MHDRISILKLERRKGYNLQIEEGRERERGDSLLLCWIRCHLFEHYIARQIYWYATGIYQPHIPICLASKPEQPSFGSFHQLLGVILSFDFQIFNGLTVNPTTTSFRSYYKTLIRIYLKPQIAHRFPTCWLQRNGCCSFWQGRWTDAVGI